MTKAHDEQCTYALAEAVPLETAIGVVDHRKSIKRPLTVYAAKLLAKQFAMCGNPQAAADHMILRGWQGFKVSWLRPDELAEVGGVMGRSQYQPQSLGGNMARLRTIQ